MLDPNESPFSSSAEVPFSMTGKPERFPHTTFKRQNRRLARDDTPTATTWFPHCGKHGQNRGYDDKSQTTCRRERTAHRKERTGLLNLVFCRYLNSVDTRQTC